MENLARYIIRASLSQERMTYVEDEGKVIYQAKDGSEKKEFAGLEWLEERAVIEKILKHLGGLSHFLI